MKVTNHLKLSLVLSLPAAYLAAPLSGIAGCLIGGVLIDADHIVDYYLNYRIPFSRKGFFSGRVLRSLLMDSPQVVGRMLRPIKRNPDGPIKTYLLLHSIELWALIAFLCFKHTFILPVALGGIGHLISDYLTWKRPWYTFFLAGRLLKGFDLDEVQKYKDGLKRIGVDVGICLDCGSRGIHEIHYEPIDGDYRKGPIENFMALCPECHDKRHATHDSK